MENLVLCIILFSLPFKVDNTAVPIKSTFMNSIKDCSFYKSSCLVVYGLKKKNKCLSKKYCKDGLKRYNIFNNTDDKIVFET